MNVFTEESAFLDHYERARKIARFPLNHIRTWAGEDLLGRPRTDELGRPIMLNGHVVWDAAPRDGYLPDVDGGWKPVRWLAHHLQSTLVREAVSLRVTPEVRIETVPNQPERHVLIRTLSVELRMRTESPITTEQARELKLTTLPYVQLWYPLHEKIQDEWLTGKRVAKGDDGHRYANLLIRFRANHEETLPSLTV